MVGLAVVAGSSVQDEGSCSVLLWLGWHMGRRAGWQLGQAVSWLQPSLSSAEMPGKARQQGVGFGITSGSRGGN